MPFPDTRRTSRSARRAAPATRALRGLLAASTAFALLSASSAARADDPPIPPPTTDADLDERLAYLESRLAEGESPSRTWWYVWTGGFGALTVGFGIGAFVMPERELRIDAAIAATSSALGLISVAALPSKSGFGPARIRRMPNGTPEEKRARLVEAETLIDDAAKQERLGTGILAHVGSVVVNLGGGAVRWFGYDHRTTAVVGVVSGLAIGETKIWTQPTPAVTTQARYRARWATAAPAQSFEIRVLPTVGGLAVVGRFLRPKSAVAIASRHGARTMIPEARSRSSPSSVTSARPRCAATHA
jgi:hypothetical protein